MSKEIALWQGTGLARIPANARTPEEILAHANTTQLSQKDRTQIVFAFNNESYEMASTFIWTKSISSLKAQLGRLGTAFIAEMLDRSDISADASVAHVLTDYDALRLAREIGAVSSTGYFRLRQAFERIAHFGQLSSEDGDEAEMSMEEATGVVRACVEGILGQTKIDVALDFKQFRDHLESEVFDRRDSEIIRLEESPYFFKRASVRILLALVKSNTGAQLENALGNANLIFPLIWTELLPADRFQIGRAYAEVVADGKTQAASGLKKILVKVKGFDFVPEDLRSRSFMAAAQSVIEAHEGMNNFYNEPGAIRMLEQMGSTIPRPAFPICMSATLSVRLGNSYGISYQAQASANSILTKVSPERWLYYLESCLPGDERILEKLRYSQPFARWVGVVDEFDLKSMASDLKDRELKQLLQESTDPSKATRARQTLSRFLKNLGFSSEE
jgi:hypothetical protein